MTLNPSDIDHELSIALSITGASVVSTPNEPLDGSSAASV